MEPTIEFPKPRRIKLFNKATDTNPDGSLKLAIYENGGQEFETKGIAVGDLGIARMVGDRNYGDYYMDPRACYLDHSRLAPGEAADLDRRGMFSLGVELLGALPDAPINCTIYLPNGITLISQMEFDGDRVSKDPLQKNRVSVDRWLANNLEDYPRHFFVHPDPEFLSYLEFEFQTGNRYPSAKAPTSKG